MLYIKKESRQASMDAWICFTNTVLNITSKWQASSSGLPRQSCSFPKSEAHGGLSPADLGDVLEISY